MRTVLVIGGAGLVGAEFTRRLRDGAFEVAPVVVDRREPETRLEGVTYVIDPEVNIFDPADVNRLIGEHDPIALIDGVNIASIASRSRDLLHMVMDYCFEVIAPVVKRGVAWLDIGTVATGGMGVEIPYTHNEACEGEIAEGLKHKCAAASLHDGFLDLLGRTPGQRVGRVVPRAMIGFEPPFRGPIQIAHLGGVPEHVRGAAVSLADVRPVVFETLADAYVGVGSRCGENGVFGLEETIAITSIGQMEPVTAQAVACGAMDVFGRILANSGTYVKHDVHPDVTSFAERNRVMDQLAALREQHGEPSVCFGNLGPYLSTHLWELWTLSQAGFTLRTLAGFTGTFEPSPEILDRLASRLPSLRIPALTDSGFIPAYEGEAELTADAVRAQIERTGVTGENHLWFVDLRTSRVEFWKEQAERVRTASCVRSHLPHPEDEPLGPGEFWASFNAARGHGREAYAAGARY